MRKVAKVLLGHTTVENGRSGNFLVCQGKEGEYCHRIPIRGENTVISFNAIDMFGEDTKIKVELSLKNGEYVYVISSNSNEENYEYSISTQSAKRLIPISKPIFTEKSENIQV